MGECIISRAAGEAEAALPLSPDRHTILVTLKDSSGTALQNFPIYCIDGSTTYNYKTNEKGQSIFMCNSGAANIVVNNNIGGYQYLDFQNAIYNVDAPIGMTSKLNINIADGNTFYEFTSTKNFGLMRAKECEVILVGGGGGGGGGWESSDGEDTNEGGGGGAGYLNSNNFILGPSSTYKFTPGLGGSPGNTGTSSCSDGGSGGTSSLTNLTSEEGLISAVGGSGGTSGRFYYRVGGKGGLGDGYMSNSDLNNGNSTVDFAGGGGGWSYYNYNTGISNYSSGGWPYGGTESSTTSGNTKNGSRGGGGCQGDGWRSKSASWGGSGLMRINITY